MEWKSDAEKGFVSGFFEKLINPGATYLTSVVHMVYLAGPIDGNSSGSFDWVADASKLLLAKGITSFRPHYAYSAPDITTAPRVRAINRKAIRESNALLAYLPRGVMTIGTIREIEYAKTKGKDVIVFSDTNLDHFLELYDVIAVANLAVAVQLISEGKLGPAVGPSIEEH